MGQRLPKERIVRPARDKPEPGAFAVQCRTAGRLQYLEKAEFKESADRIRLLVARYKLLVAAQHEQPPMSIEEAVAWVDLALPMKTWLYNEDGCISSLTGAVSLLQEEVKWPLDHVNPRLRAHAEEVIEKMVFRDFWTGETLSRDSCKWMPLIPCKYLDVRNFVCVNPRIDATSAFDALLLVIPKGESVIWESTRADTPLPKDELPLRQIPERQKPLVDSLSTTVVDAGRGVVPRTSVLGWIARVYLYLVDKFGVESVPSDYLDPAAVLDFVKLERTYEEYYFELMCSHITSDFNPFMLLPAKARSVYAEEVLRRTDTLAIPQPRDFQYTVTGVYTKTVATVVDASGEAFEVDTDDPELDPMIQEALKAYQE